MAARTMLGGTIISTAIIGEVSAASVLAVLTAVIAWRHPWWRRTEDLHAMEAWLENFSPDSCRPMLRLADRRDTPFLSRHRGAEEAARYRRLQRLMLKEYLRILSRDFHRLQVLAADNSADAPDDRGNSSLALVEEKLEFVFSVWSIEICLLLGEIAPRSINLLPLLANVDLVARRARQRARRRLDFRVSARL